ncbi:hypothetical protein PVAP13_5NG333005 [Panicum virgatum]|uniref:Uncharacterized protein n=1 Tax=Panicum virgatum TaxID=38727 RepID=A0A8T0RPV7_PANVG|nr:hypothetical protein PVAP13_5NG333005 [Panicum virgatum]
MWFRCPISPDAMETDNIHRVIEHALNFKLDAPSPSSTRGLLANTFMVRRRRRLMMLSTISLMIPPRTAMADVVWGRFFCKCLNLLLPFPLPHRAQERGCIYICFFLCMYELLLCCMSYSSD